MSRTLAEVADLLATLAAEDEAQATALADYPRVACRVRARSQLLAALAADIRRGVARLLTDWQVADAAD